MKKIFTIGFLLMAVESFAQTGIGTVSPSASAALDVSSTTKGLLVPRFATSAITNITSPTAGLLIYDSTAKGFYVYTGTAWTAVSDNLGSHSATKNIALNGNYISNNGGNNGIKVDNSGTVSISNNIGSTNDVLANTGSGVVGFKKGYGTQSINYIIATAGDFPLRNGTSALYSNQVIGEIRLFAGNFAPDGFALCNGALLPIASNTALFSILGTTYGGNGTTNFKLPDLRSAVPVGQGTNGVNQNWTLGETNH